ncbi:MAG: tetratricopeptide repeat protein [Pirellulales bacterium]|nr:tetratricopeptide repeat protein [Pirellulales bacterium]
MRTDDQIAATNSRRRWLIRPSLVLVMLLPIAAAFVPTGCNSNGDSEPADPSSSTADAMDTATYVGSASCKECHEKEHHDWHESHHDLAMDLATPDKVLGDFDDVSFESKFGVKSRMKREGDEFFFTTEGGEGNEETFKVKYVFGVDPLQQYLVEFPDGRVQCLNVAWDTKRKKWFDLYQNELEKYPPGDPMHWTGWANTWNHMCADCHSTDVKRNYDLATDTYKTTFFEIDVGCEACHGPGSHHVELAKTKNWSTELGYGLVKLKGKDPTTQLETCAKCHSHHGVVHHGFEPGKRFDDHYSLALLDSELYFPDGQVHGEAYVYGSFLQSRMFREGVRCTDCHDPHSLKLKHAGNKLCSQCHKPEKYDTPTHHFHKAGTAGASCVECHMPERHYMVVDPRRDHNIRVPRPDLSVKLGTPNACTKCHLEIKNDEPEKWPLYQDWLAAAEAGDAKAKRKIEELDQWAADVIVEKFGDRRPDDPHYGPTIDAARRGEPEAEKDLIRLASSNRVGPVVKASAVALLRNYQSPESAEAIIAATRDADARVRAAAVASMPMPALLQVLPEMLNDENRLVRHEATRMLSLVFNRREFPSHLRKTYLDALKQLSDDQAPSADAWQTHVNLGGIYANIGEYELAEKHFRHALKINKLSVPALEGLTQMLLRRNQMKDAEQLWRDHLKNAPESFMGHFNLGLLIAEDRERLAEAAESLAKAVEIQPDFTRGHFNLGLARQQLKQWDSAERHLNQAYQLAPHVPDNVMALVGFYQERKQLKKAEDVLLAAVRSEPLSVGLVGALMNFYVENKQPAKADEALRSALKREPKSPSLLQSALMFYAQQGELKKAEIYAERLLAIRPDDRGVQATLDQIRRQIDRQKPGG